LKNDDGEEQKTVLHFMEAVKPMVINRTNAQLIGIATGAKTAGESRGKKIVVYNDPTVGFGGKITGGLRIKKLAGEPKPVNSGPIPGIADAGQRDDEDEFGDGIPFN
jgi:hypothetical protein